MGASVSVVIPTYNGAKFIRETIASVWSQTELPCEIVVVDDCSTDDTIAILKHLQSSSPVSLTIIERSANSGGPAKAINEGVRQSRGDWIAVLDQDDVYLPSRIARDLESVEGDTSIVCIVSLAAYLECPESPILNEAVLRQILSHGENVGQGVRVDGGRILQLLIVYGCFAYGFPGFLFRKDVWTESSAIDESLRIVTDYEWLCSLAVKGAFLLYPRIGYLRRVHAANLSNDTARCRCETRRVMLKYIHKALCHETPPGLSTALANEAYAAVYSARRAAGYRGALRELLLYLWAGRYDIGFFRSLLSNVGAGIVAGAHSR